MAWHMRKRRCQPVSHVLEHRLHAFHGPHLPSVAAEMGGVSGPRRPLGQGRHLPALCRALTRALKVAALPGVSEGPGTRGPGWARHTAFPAALLGPISTGHGARAPGTPF